MRRMIKAELTMLIGEIKQYYLNYVFYNMSMVVLFFGLFYNYFHMETGPKIISMLVSAVLWQMSMSGIQYLSNVIQDEALMGTLEQIFLTRTSFFEVMFSKTLVNSLFVLIKGILLFLICSLCFRKTSVLLSIKFGQYISIILIVFTTIMSFYCIGGFFGGLSLYFKRVSSILGVVNYFLLMFTGITADISDYNMVFRTAIRLIPITNANLLIDEILCNSISKTNIYWYTTIIILSSMLGLTLLNLLIKRAKKEGKLGQY